MNLIKVLSLFVAVISIGGCAQLGEDSSKQTDTSSTKQPAVDAFPDPKASVGEKAEALWKWFVAHEQELDSMSGPRSSEFQQLVARIKSVDERLRFEIAPGPKDTKELALSADGREELFPLVEQVVAKAPKMRTYTIVAFCQRVPLYVLKGLEFSARPEAPEEAGKAGKAIRPGKTEPAGAVNDAKAQKPGKPSEEKAGKARVADLSRAVEASKQGKAGSPLGSSPPAYRVAVKDMKFKLVTREGKAEVTIFIKDYAGAEAEKFMAKSMLQQAIGEYDLVKKVSKVNYESINSKDAKDAKPFVDIGPTFDKSLAIKSTTVK